MSIFAKQLLDNYDFYKEKSLNHRRIKHKDILPLIFKKSKKFNVQEIGKSYEGREIYLLKIGTGETKIMLWSQMHGNESTATQALFDIFNVFENPEEFKPETDEILQNCTLLFIPMLNPDGAERFQRRNAQEIDINRDALKQEAPESKILMNLRNELQVDFGFNLHDQDIWYSAGNTKFPATLSFLAPSYNSEKETNTSREQSMQVIASINKMLQDFIPNQIAKYDDGFMPTAFGDNIQKRGTSTILIESGGYYNDPEKQFVRKLNFVSILHALNVISKQSYKQVKFEEYHELPFNKKNKLFDYILRNVIITGSFGKYKADIGIRSEALIDKDTFVIDDIGDLSQNYAYEEREIQNKNVKAIKIGDNAQFLINKYFNN